MACLYTAEWCGCILTVSRITYLPGWFPVAFPAVFVFVSYAPIFIVRTAVYSKTTMCSMPNVMAALPNTGGALCSTPQSLPDAHY